MKSFTVERCRGYVALALLAISLCPGVAQAQLRVNAWGDNSSGQIGDGRLLESNIPVSTQGIQNVKAVAAGTTHSVALKMDGTVWTWGSNALGQLGEAASVSERALPAPVGRLTGIIAVSASQQFNLALKNDGTVWGWGDNSSGQLGDGTTLSRFQPAPVPGLTGVAAIAAGGLHSMALKADGTVWTWGGNREGQLGDGTLIDHWTPAPVNGLNDVIAISAGTQHSMALKSDGTVWAWGKNFYGEIGDGTRTRRLTPVSVSGLAGITAISGGGAHSLALKNDGTVWAWGNNQYGQLGDGTTVTVFPYARLTPVKVVHLTEVVSMAAGGEFSLVVKSDGTAWTWGRNWHGALGNGSYSNSSAPVAVAGLTDVTAIALFNHGLAVKQDGTVWAWGTNNDCQLSSGGIPQYADPLLPENLTDVIAISAGSVHSLALKSDGTVRAWGRNNQGQLGNTAYPIGSGTPVAVNGLTGVTEIAAGFEYSVAAKSDGTVWAWGRNASGQLGIGTFITRYEPVLVTGINDVVNIAAGLSHTLAIKSDGTVWGWGNNKDGQLGDGSVINSSPWGRSNPMPVTGLTSVIAVSAGDNHSLALKEEGTVWGFGLGYGSLPIQVTGLSEVVSIAAGYYSNLAVKADGTVWKWGNTVNDPPVQIEGLSDIVSVSRSRDNFSLALKSDGTIWAWGTNHRGQLGDGTLTNRSFPVQVNAVSGATAIAAGGVHSLAIANPVARVSGVLTLEDISPDAAQMITFTFRPEDNSGNQIRTGLVTPEGTFSAHGLPLKNYTLHIQGPRYLTANVSVNAQGGDVNDVTALLLAGDANADNSVDALDLDALVQAFDQREGEADYNPTADFNNDGFVDVLDLDILVRNFDRQGDP